MILFNIRLFDIVSGMSVGVNLEWKLENVVGKLGSGWVIVNGVDEVCMG